MPPRAKRGVGLSNFKILFSFLKFMLEFLSIIQIIISALLIGAILLQARGSGLSSVFGGESTFYHTRRGMEKIIFWATIILAILFVITGIASFLF